MVNAVDGHVKLQGIISAELNGLRVTIYSRKAGKMALRTVNNVLGNVSALIRLGGTILVAVMMVFMVGSPLVFAGVPGGWVPLILGSLAFLSAGRQIFDLLR